MWDTPFTEDMFDLPNGVVINCPTQESCYDCADMIERYGIKHGDGSAPHVGSWSEYKEKFCWYVRRGRLWLGPMSSTNSSPWSGFTKSTFYGVSDSIEVASNEDIGILLGG